MGLNDFFDRDARAYKWMARAHARLWQWGLAHLKLFSPLDIVDLGCGDGHVVAELLRMFPQAKVTGVDLSPQAVAFAEKRNHGDILSRRCQILCNNVSALPFADESQDLITAFETIYFWPQNSFREIYRVLMPNGLFMIANKYDGESKPAPEWAGAATCDKLTLIRQLKEAGFDEFSVDHNTEQRWLCILARK